MDALIPWLRRTGWAYLAVAVAVALVAWRMLASDPSPQGEGTGAQVVRADGTAAAGDGPAVATAPAAGPRLVVHVAGEVRRPGVYDLAPGARVRRAVARAGGPTRRADMALLNLAATVRDGQQVVVPARAPAGAPADAGVPAAPAGPLSLSSATAEQLEELDGIGPTLAGRIVEFRRERGGFASVDQLLEVRGIGPARLEALRSRVVP